MKAFIKLLSLTVCTVMLLCCTAVTSAADGVRRFDPVTDLSMNNPSDSEQTVKLGMKLTDSGTVKLFAAASGTDKSTPVTLTDSKGSVIKSGKLSAVAGKSIRISKKGNYYLELKLGAEKSVNKLCYTFTADSCEKHTCEDIDLNVGKTIDLTSYAVDNSKDMGERIKWTTSNSKAVRVGKNGKIKTVGEGTAVLRAYGSGGGLVTIRINVSDKYKPAASDNSFLAAFEEDVTGDDVKALCKKYSLTVLYDYDFSNMYAFKLKSSLTESQMTDFLEKFAKEKGVIYAEPDQIIYIDDPLSSNGILIV